ncbi:MAG: hypothetical protein K9K76_09465 [Halanaerobiales bacterium]|nr:hypothetical protein [Halanaerobiales bacterium]
MFNVVITTNSPGEVSAWVKPIIRQLNKKKGDKNIYVFTPPCVFSSGEEQKVTSNIRGVKASYNSMEYLKYIIFNKKPGNFVKTSKGFVLFLGGDLMHAYFLGKKLNYPVYVYTERDYGFVKSIKKFYVSEKKIYDQMINDGISKEKVFLSGNLMYDAVKPELDQLEIDQLNLLDDNKKHLINLLPGSRPKEVRFILPLYLNLIREVNIKRNDIKFVISKSKFISDDFFKEVIDQINDDYNVSYNNNIINIDNKYYIKVFDEYLYSIMKESDFALTIPGTNNLELTVLKTPFLVILPLNKPADIPLPGLIGLFGEIPVLGTILKRYLVPKMAKKRKYVSLVNLINNSNTVPEMVGQINSKILKERFLKLIEDKRYLKIKEKLAKVETKKGAAKLIVDDIIREIS